MELFIRCNVLKTAGEWRWPLTCNL